MAEWTKATDCKSVSYTHVGSNPAFFIYILCYKRNSIYKDTINEGYNKKL